MTISVVIADDHRVVRDGLCYLLSQESDVVVAGEAGDGRRAVDVVAATRPDVLLLDLYMPGLDGHAVLAALHDAPHRPAVVVLTSAGDDDNLVHAMQAGATGYLLKTAPAEEVIAAIRDAAAGAASLSPELVTQLTRALSRHRCRIRWSLSHRANARCSGSLPAAIATGRSPGIWLSASRPSRPTSAAS